MGLSPPCCKHGGCQPLQNFYTTASYVDLYMQHLLIVLHNVNHYTGDNDCTADVLTDCESQSDDSSCDYDFDQLILM